MLPPIVICEPAEGLAELLQHADLQTVVADQAQQRDDGVEHSQEAQGGQHVTGALLQDKFVHVEERVLIILGVAAPAVFIICIFTGNLSVDKNDRNVPLGRRRPLQTSDTLSFL